MAANIDIAIQNGRKRFIQTIALTTTPSLTTLASTTVDGVPVGAGSTLCFQADADSYVMLRPASASGTIPITATSALRIPQYLQEYTRCSQNPFVGLDGKIEAMAATGTSNLQIFLVDPN